MRILLTEHYSHWSGVRLSPGEYEAGDPRVGGLAPYLVQTQQARRIDVAEEDRPDDAEDVVTIGGFTDYDAMKKADLITLADKRGVNLSDAHTKPAIIAALLTADAVDNAPLADEMDNALHADTEPVEPPAEDWTDEETG